MGGTVPPSSDGASLYQEPDALFQNPSIHIPLGSDPAAPTAKESKQRSTQRPNDGRCRSHRGRRRQVKVKRTGRPCDYDAPEDTDQGNYS
jgi:hypothetical protein